MHVLTRGSLLAAVFSAMAAIAPSTANAGITIKVSIDDGSGFVDVTAQGVFVPLDGATGNNVVGFGTFTEGGTTFNNFQITATSNAPGTASNGTLTNVSVTSVGSSGTGTIKIEVVQTTPFSLPGVSGQLLRLTSTVSRSDAIDSTSNPLTFQSWVDPDGASALPELSPGLQTHSSASGNLVPPNLLSLDFTRGSTYSLRNTLTLEALGGEGQQNVSGSTIVTGPEFAPVPEPGTIAMALTALPLMGLGYYVRRRGRA